MKDCADTTLLKFGISGMGSFPEGGRCTLADGTVPCLAWLRSGGTHSGAGRGRGTRLRPGNRRRLVHKNDQNVNRVRSGTSLLRACSGAPGGSPGGGRTGPPSSSSGAAARAFTESPGRGG